ncbi:alanine--tRNA ligase [Pediococcus acidilactici]|jgi:alanyl-tRNA synthetase|uniref:alanine--tRNA ligase n=1 Tax=Pediococcus acidilactici TaxID=1254 RepID=UPI0006B3FD49|nr:alanine--tRNA ligase [Pediococcus acidilactici]KAF0371150.1 alanine--tRNA ligase [Pediococcus acidilactici]KAF0382401.1 alanine--tRNA ligase [Pediococcus acidilactici]KAF0455919.1 alanine--tRNA ligase [Pediococcus acidilactici]KAF0475722.1 alanine--tRNA ligase [Pediococcus acidilactici]KAF0535830.1 alanine--tRNA ligase [Pediococcus acidilactici]
MERKSSSEIRRMYLDFFKSKGHVVEPSASLIPKDDPTLLWVNSGVATMKKYFDGSVVPEVPRLTSSQKSIRTNDIENVGHTARHHTLFEMLGNFSVGDYFKEEAIHWAWELLTSKEWFDMDPEKLYVTVYPKDEEAKKIWLETGVDPSHIVEAEDNFWDIGEGPSGPDSEIFYDRGEEFNNLADDDPENYPGGENERWLEIWNIVFSQFNHKPDGTYEPLPHKNIDTGMGLERVVSVFQDAPTNFETDLFLPIIHEVEKLSGKKYGVDKNDDVSFKVIADHARAITFAIGDGAIPSNEGRGYVIRRLLRRAVMHGKKLNINKPFLYQMVPVVGKIMEDYYPEVLADKDYIEKVIKSEEDRFNETLTDGLELLNSIIADTKADHSKVISGKDAFRLFDTYGFPLELAKEYAEDQGMEIDEAGFADEMQKQKERARSARSNAKSMGVQSDLLTDLKTPSEYVGYDTLKVDAAVLKDIVQDDQLTDTVNPGEARVLFDVTPFYAEMGGQVADQGVIEDADGNVVAEVVDVQHAPNGQNLHTIKAKREMHAGESFTLIVDRAFHLKVEKNHTATHLLDQALRDVLGEHTHQAGSLVEPGYLRFDFTHFGQVTDEDLQKVEEIINDKIYDEIPVTTVETDLETGKKMGAIALFDDKYGKKVRVVSVGDYSREFCGGTHVKNTNEIGLFKIVSESGVGAGVRRIEAVTSQAALEFLNGEEALLQKAAGLLKSAQVKDVPAKVEQLQAQVKDLNQTINQLEAKIAQAEVANIYDQVQEINGIRLITAEVQVSGMDQLRQMADDWKTKDQSDVLVLGAKIGEKANLIAAVKDPFVEEGLKAGDLIKAIAPKVNGGGGGRPNMAQAGGSAPEKINEALKAASEWLETQGK